jgi:hypothetical protein
MDSYAPLVKELLRNAGCSFLRHGKGDHDIWHSPIVNRHFPVAYKIKSRHTANEILRQAGLPKAF